MVGQSAARFETTDKLGARGMGEVYWSTDTRLNRQVRLTVLPQALAQYEQRITVVDAHEDLFRATGLELTRVIATPSAFSILEARPV